MHPETRSLKTLSILFLTILLLFGLNTAFAQHHPQHLESATDTASATSLSVSSTEEGVKPSPSAEPAHAEQHDPEAIRRYIGTVMPFWSVIPFLGILFSIALFPLLAPHFWHQHYPKVSLFWSLVLAIPFLIAFKGLALFEIGHIFIIDYIPFIILLWGLFTASGGILLRGTIKGTPAVNTLMLLVGTALASWMGTTGASMLLIRPVIRANAERKTKMQVIIFFVFMVSNIGGALTPLGDPPLFLGFIHGVPFFWTFKILPHMLLVVGILTVLFYLIDTIIYRREGVKFDYSEKVPLKLEGSHNFIFLLGILGAVLLSGKWRPGSINFFDIHIEIQNLARDLIIIAMGLLSIITTRKITRQDNAFTWDPIKEVAYLFAGIFMCIIPALAMLRAGSDGEMAFVTQAVREPWHFFWITGALSSFLDNAPTYLTFFNTALGSLKLPEYIVNPLLSGMALDPASVHSAVSHLNLSPAQAQALSDNLISGAAEKFIFVLKGISAGAVFFGSNTYIGNAPNFMVRSIAEENHIKMPSFFGYMLWSIGILIPSFILVTLIFFKP